jgi:hypothetical protein
MTDQNKDINAYTAKDFELYHSGKMSAHEMHRLEKAALDDPFLEDALEGYKITATPVADVHGLQAALDSRTDKGTVVHFAKRWTNGMWWKVAAMLILVIGFGWIIYNVSFINAPSDLAKVEGNSDKSTSPITSNDTSENSSLNTITEEVAEGATTSSTSPATEMQQDSRPTRQSKQETASRKELLRQKMLIRTRLFHTGMVLIMKQPLIPQLP